MHTTGFLLVVLTTVICAVRGRGPLVTLPQGQYQGNFISRGNRYIHEYLGIPFAKPPIGDLRLADPQPVDKHEEVYQAKKFGPSCPQLYDTVFGNFSGATMWNPPGAVSEDCLNLNIWVPHKSFGGKMNVLVWIYGGGLFSGSSALDIYNGQILADIGDIIVVTFNYRVGALGFLSIGDDRLPGNYGFMDQVMALQWVKDNIGSFNGDPDKITLVGESAGAVSVFYHTLSPLSSGLFQRAIIQSPAIDDCIFQDPVLAAQNARVLIDRLNCDANGDFVACLRKASVSSFLDNQFKVKQVHNFGFHPTISPFMPKPPQELLESGEFERRDILLGVNKDEGTYFMVYAIKSLQDRKKKNPGLTRDQMKELMSSRCPKTEDEDKQDEIIDYYTEGTEEEDLQANLHAMDDILGDSSFKCPTKVVADSMAEKGGNIYYYFFSHRPSIEVWPKWMGVIHAAEIPFVFGQPTTYPSDYTNSERTFSSRMINYFTNFAKTGNPNNQGDSPWPRYTLETKQYIELSTNEQIHEGGYRTDQCRFWDRLRMSGANSQSASFFLITAVCMAVMVLYLQ